MSDMSPVKARVNAGDLEFVDKASGTVVLAHRQAVGSLLAVSAADALTAHSGGGQTNALQLTAAVNRVTTVAAAADSVKLLASLPGLQMVVANAAATNSMNVFPATGDAINALSANAAFAVAANKTALFICTAAGQWMSILTA